MKDDDLLLLRARFGAMEVHAGLTLMCDVFFRMIDSTNDELREEIKTMIRDAMRRQGIV